MSTKEEQPPPYTPDAGKSTSTPAPEADAPSSYAPPPGQPPSETAPALTQRKTFMPNSRKAVSRRFRRESTLSYLCGTALPTVISISVLSFLIVGLFIFAIAIPFTLVGAKVLGYSTRPLTNTYTDGRYDIYGNRRTYSGLSGQYARALAAGTSVVTAALVGLGWICGLFWALTGNDSMGGPFLFYTLVGAGCIAATAIVSGVGAALRPITDFSAHQAFRSGGVGFAVLGGSIAVVFVCVVYLMSR
ncbi:hypothetical protein OH76DRAFT_1398689 [Lentinus brumalis]|uniref:Uncharacterized protein n=1 Tax=Lentinus brumalis TaxID=2498619 RepID=A0A371DPB7_9APHY|nr:hypothetical protein OH76DRAFT_1398689 [Polyporus brumalis]